MRKLLISAMMMMGAGAAMAQPVQWRVQDGGNGHWYEGFRHSSLLRWVEAQSLAATRGGHLVTLTSAAENEFVRQYANSKIELWQNIYGGPWLGGYQDRTAPDYSEPTGGWRWVTGEPWVYQNWYSGEPDNFRNNEHWICFANFSGTWLDLADATTAVNETQAYIIEYSADCNNDGIVDKGQILSGELPDANNNGIPDWSVTVVRQPTNQAVGVDQPVYFSVEVSSSPGCTTPVSYRWERRNPQVLDANAPNAWVALSDGGGFLNTSTASLTILRPTAGLATGYRCKISGGCGCEGNGTGVLYTNVVNFAPACPSDFNNDGSVDGDDVITFFERWDGGC
jgi:hypothetical protein